MLYKCVYIAENSILLGYSIVYVYFCIVINEQKYDT